MASGKEGSFHPHVTGSLELCLAQEGGPLYLVVLVCIDVQVLTEEGHTPAVDQNIFEHTRVLSLRLDARSGSAQPRA